jgi:excinuclease UvrABC nuclease subunit
MALANNARAWNRANIESLNPNQSGCYGIFNQRQCIYIGKGDIRTRLLAHYNGDNPCITRNGPTYWRDVVTADMDNEEKRLILEYRPVCNQRVG